MVEWPFYQQHKDFYIDHAHPGNVHNSNYTERIKASRKIGGHILYGPKALSLYYLYCYYHYFYSTTITINNA